MISHQSRNINRAVKCQNLRSKRQLYSYTKPRIVTGKEFYEENLKKTTEKKSKKTRKSKARTVSVKEPQSSDEDNSVNFGPILKFFV